MAFACLSSVATHGRPISSMLVEAPTASTSGRASCNTKHGRYSRAGVCQCTSTDPIIEDEWLMLAEGRKTIGRNSWQKHRKMGKKDATEMYRLAQTLSLMSDSQRQLLRPYLSETVANNLEIAAKIKRSNQGRSRQEKLVAKMLTKEHSDEAIAIIFEQTERLASTTSGTGVNEMDELALTWRTALLATDDDEEQERVTTLVIKYAIECGADITELNLLIRRAREEQERAVQPEAPQTESDAVLVASESEDEDSRVPRTLTAEQLAAFMEETLPSKTVRPANRVEKNLRKRGRKALLKYLKVLAKDVLANNIENEFSVL